MKRFELWLANMNSNNGNAVKKIRPVVIIQTDLLNGIHESTVVCPLTTKTVDGVQLLRVQVDSSQVDHKSDILVDQITIANNNFIIVDTCNIKVLMPTNGCQGHCDRLRINQPGPIFWQLNGV